MRTFYIFNIKNNLYSVYKDSPKEIFKIFKNISNIVPNDIAFATNIFFQLSDYFDKSEMDRNIFIKYHNDITYTKNNDTHIYNDINKDELSYMTIRNTYILIRSNKNFSSFFKILDKYSYNFFICDFKNKDYFYLKDIKTLV